MRRRFPKAAITANIWPETAAALLAERGRGFADLPESGGAPHCRAFVLAAQRAEQDQLLADFGVHFTVHTSEQAVYQRGLIDTGARACWSRRGLTFEKDGALWLRTTDFGDDQDRVLRKQDGTYTYFLPDIAYHVDKHDRGFTRVIDVWGADHHGYIPRMRAALLALGYGEEFFDVELVQLVKVVRGGEEVKMSKRSGEFVTLRDLCDEVGVDAARYFFLRRQGDSHLIFDVDLARKQTDENPVFYVQMAHARLSGIFRTAGLAPDEVAGHGGPRGAARAGGHRAGQGARGVSRSGGKGGAGPGTAPGNRLPGGTGRRDSRLVSPDPHRRGGRPRWSVPACCLPGRPGSSSATDSASSASRPQTGCDDMSLLVVGSVALDSVYTPFGETADALGGSAVYFSVAGSILHRVQVVGVIGQRLSHRPAGRRSPRRGIDWTGVEQADGESFRWKGKYSYDLQSRETLETRLGVFADFVPKLPERRTARYLFLGNIDPELQLGVLEQVRAPALVACDTMNYWIQSKRDVLLHLLRQVDILMVNDSEARELSGDWNIHRAGRWILRHGPRRVVIKQGEHGALMMEEGRTFYVPRFPWKRSSIRPARATRSPAGSWPTSPRRTTPPARTSGGRWSTARRWDPMRSSGSASAGSTGSPARTSSGGSSCSVT